jgi:hypothetical protein
LRCFLLFFFLYLSFYLLLFLLFFPLIFPACVSASTVISSVVVSSSCDTSAPLFVIKLASIKIYSLIRTSTPLFIHCEIISKFLFLHLSFILPADKIRIVTLHKNEIRSFGEISPYAEIIPHNAISFQNSFSYPTSLCVSEISNHIFVGFSDGKVTKYSTNIHDNKSCEILDTVTVHATSVKVMRTFHISQPTTSRTQKHLIPRRVLVLLVCDECGVVSVWDITEESSEAR